MAMSFVLKMFVIVVVLGVVVAGLGELDVHYGNIVNAASLNQTNINMQAAYTANVYNPLTATVQSAANSANNESTASASQGFAYAFIIPQFGTIYSSIIGMPGIMQQYFTQMLMGLNIPGISAPAYAAIIAVLFIAMLALFALSLWFKVPLI